MRKPTDPYKKSVKPSRKKVIQVGEKKQTVNKRATGAVRTEPNMTFNTEID